MNITYFVHCFYPNHFFGTESYTFNIANHAKRRGHGVNIVSAKFPGEKESKQFLHKYEYRGLTVYEFDKNRMKPNDIGETYYQPEMYTHLLNLVKRLRPDIVHITHLLNHTAVLLRVLDELKIPTVATFTDYFGFCFNCKLQPVEGGFCSGPSLSRTNCLACFLKEISYNQKFPILKFIFNKTPWVIWTAHTLRFFSRFPFPLKKRHRKVVSDLYVRPDILKEYYHNYAFAVAPSRVLKKAYLKNGFTSPLKLQHFGVDIDRSLKPEKPAGSKIRFGYIGQFDRHKGIDILLQAFADVEEAELHLYGKSDQNTIYMKQLKQLNRKYASPAIFQGTFPPQKLAEILANIDYLVIPSRWSENSPLILLQALATHTPVVVSDVDGMTEFVTEGKNGFIFPVDNVVALSNILNRIVSDPDMSRRMSNSTHYYRTTDDMGTDIIESYNQLLN